MGFDWSAHNAQRAEYDKRPLASKAQKDELLKAETVFEIVGVRGPHQTKFGKAWFVDANTAQDEITMSFAWMDGGGRDQLLAGMMDHLNGEGAEPIKAKLVHWGEAKEGKNPMWGLERA